MIEIWSCRLSEYALEEPCKRAETQIIINQNITEPSITILILTQDERNNAKLIKKITTKKKGTLPSIRNENWKK